MNVYTGYFAQMKKYRAKGLVPVSIAFATPVWYEGETCFEVAPPYRLLRQYKDLIIDWEEYKQRYLEYLKTNVAWGEVINKLFDISEKHDDADLVLCCFEKNPDPCHRHLLAEFLTKYGMKCEEVDI